MTDQDSGGQMAFEQTPLSDIHGPERKPIDELIPDSAELAAADDGPAPADPPHVSPVDPAGADGQPDPAPEQEPAPEPAPEPEPKPEPAAVPLTAGVIGDIVSRSVAAALQQREARQPQAQEEIPDPEIDPAGAYTYHQRQTEEALLNHRVSMSTSIMRQMVPDFDDVLGGADMANLKSYTQANPQMAPVLQRMLATSDHPAKAAYDFLKREQMVQKIGGDLSAYDQKVIERYKAEQAAKQPAGNNPPAAQTAGNAPAQPASPQAQQAAAPAPAAGNDPNAPAFEAPAIPKMMGDDRSSPPRDENFKGPISLEDLDKVRPGGKLRRIA